MRTRVFCLNEDGVCYELRPAASSRCSPTTNWRKMTCAWPRPRSPETGCSSAPPRGSIHPVGWPPNHARFRLGTGCGYADLQLSGRYQLEDGQFAVSRSVKWRSDTVKGRLSSTPLPPGGVLIPVRRRGGPARSDASRVFQSARFWTIGLRGHARSQM